LAQAILAQVPIVSRLLPFVCRASPRSSLELMGNTTKKQALVPDFLPGNTIQKKQPRTVERQRPCCSPCWEGAWPRRRTQVTMSPDAKAKPISPGQKQARADSHPQLAGPNAPTVVVVDPYSSGRFLVYQLAPKYQIICVRSTLQLGGFFLKVYETHKQYYKETIVFESMPQLLARLKASKCKNIVAVFAGSDPAVELADKLAEALQLSARNDTKLTKARKDKAAMQERLRECGLRAAEQIRSANLFDLLQWATARNQWPLVAKPTGSSGSDGIFFCKDLEDVRGAHAEIVGKMNPNGKFNAELVLQEFLSGTEYIVDTVSHAGKHICVAVWVYTKRKGTPWNPNCIVSEGNKLLPASGMVQDALTSYVFKVLNAIALRYGPCHTEVILTARGPVLVEVNARMHGLQGPHLIGLATGTSKAKYTVDALAEGGQLIQRRLRESPSTGRWLYPLEKHCLQMVLISPVHGYLAKSVSKKIQDMKLPSVVEVLPSTQKGQYLQQTCCLNTAAGNVLMVHESAAQIEADKMRIRKAEESGRLYEVSEHPIPGSPVPSPQSPGSALRSPATPRMHSAERAEELWAANLEDRLWMPMWRS